MRFAFLTFPQLEELEVLTVLADAGLPVDDRAAVLELDRDRRRRQQWARKEKPGRSRDGVERAVHSYRVPSAASHVAGTPRRR